MAKLFYLGVWLIGQIVGPILMIFARVINEEYELHLAIVGLLLGLSSWFVMATLVYKLWALIQDGHARLKPITGGILMAIPLVNLFASLITMPWLAEDYNLYLIRHSIKVDYLPAIAFKVFGVSTVLILVPFLNLLAGIVALFSSIGVVCYMCDAVNCLKQRISLPPDQSTQPNQKLNTNNIV